MKIKEAERFGPYDWPQAGRPLQPYRIDPVSITAHRKKITDQGVADPDTVLYLDGPIHTEVLKLAPNDGQAFAEFAANLGLHGFDGWLEEITNGPWPSPDGLSGFLSVLERYATGFRSFTYEELVSAWNSLPDDAINHHARSLREAFTYSMRYREDPVRAANGVLNRGWEARAFEVEIAIDLDNSPAIIYERPRHIWARAWFELIEGLRDERLPKTCAHCGYQFVPRRSNARFCDDRCARRAYEKKRSKDPKRKKAQAARYLKRKDAGQTGLSDGQPHGQSSPDQDDIDSNAEETGRQQKADPAGTRRISSKET